MAITIDASIGGLNSNSYLTLSRAATLSETLPHMDDWITDTSINKPRLLIHATRMIDRYFIPCGRKANALQSLMWPQSGLFYDGETIAIPSDIIPLFVEHATLEWAWNLNDNPDPYETAGHGLRELDTPSYRMEFTGEKGRIVPQVVADLLSPYTIRRQKPFNRLIRV